MKWVTHRVHLYNLLYSVLCGRLHRPVSNQLVLIWTRRNPINWSFVENVSTNFRVRNTHPQTGAAGRTHQTVISLYSLCQTDCSPLPPLPSSGLPVQLQKQRGEWFGASLSRACDGGGGGGCVECFYCSAGFKGLLENRQLGEDMGDLRMRELECLRV